MSLQDLPSVREMAERHDLLARKSLGQHFLFDLNVTRKIARLAGIEDGSRVLEVGPGPGGLTRALLEAGARVVAVETDSRFLPALEELGAAAPGRLTLVQADALKVDSAALLGALPGDGPAAIVSNLPYNVGTPLLTGWLSAEPPPAPSLTLMFQAEVARRIVAAPGSKDYGRLTVLTAARAKAAIGMHVPARAFVPPPKVDSAVVRIDMRPEAERFMDVAALEKVTQAAFSQRRKTIRNGLSSLGDAAALLAAAGVDATLRPEQIPPEGFLALARTLRG